MKKEKVAFVIGRYTTFIIIISFLQFNLYGKDPSAGGFKIAFIADAHFHDVYAEFKDHSFVGLKNGVSGKNATIRTMQAQLMSTRLFNENYFALYAALDDLVQKGIKYVGLAGDFSDDGQMIHLRGLNKILDVYTREYGMSFFAIPGNHDPGEPMDSPGGKKNFMGEGGQEQKIFSKGTKECDQTSVSGKGLPTICTQEIADLGYEGIINEMGRYGLYPQKDYLYWTTPYCTFDYDTYSYEKALKESAMNSRAYEICVQGTGGKYKEKRYTNCLMVDDATYLVEPVEGVWLLAVDANVYVPTKNVNSKDLKAPGNFEGSGNAGYNKMISHKKHVVDWMAKVAKEADKRGKILITFSHYPMVDFYDHNSKLLGELFGKDNLDLKRMPTEETSRTMAKTGVKMNIGGHLHFNDTGVREYDGDFLVNIQVPSLAAYVPGYKILTVKDKDVIEVETVEMGDVPKFKELFEHYWVEHQYLTDHDPSKNWNIDMLKSGDYCKYTDWHLIELTRKRFLPQWPEDLQDMLKNMNGEDILVYTQLDMNMSMSDLAALKEGKVSSLDPKVVKAWNEAKIKVKQRAEANNLHVDDFKQWNGFDLAVDFYRLMNADEMALKYIKRDRIDEYSLIYSKLINNNSNLSNEKFKFYFSRLFTCMYNFNNAEPSDKFIINFSKKEIVDLGKNTNRMH